MGRVPAFIHTDIDWTPYQGTDLDVRNYGFFACLTREGSQLEDLVVAMKNLTDSDYQV